MPAGAGAPLWPLAVYALLVVVVTAALLALSSVLGQRHRERDTDQPYESGIVTTRYLRSRFDVQFYLTAMFFLVFDLESVFLYAWAVVLRQVGWAGFAEMAFFIAIVAATLAYLWRDGALDMRPRRKEIPEAVPQLAVRHEQTAEHAQISGQRS